MKPLTEIDIKKIEKYCRENGLNVLLLDTAAKIYRVPEQYATIRKNDQHLYSLRGDICKDNLTLDEALNETSRL